jgi:hypothetical protein
MEHENNSQRRNYFQRVNLISVEGPYKKTRWFYLPIIILAEKLKGLDG